MRQGRKKGHSEPERHHDPLAYHKICLKDLSETVKRCNEMIRVAKVGARSLSWHKIRWALYGYEQTQVGITQ